LAISSSSSYTKDDPSINNFTEYSESPSILASIELLSLTIIDTKRSGFASYLDAWILAQKYSIRCVISKYLQNIMQEIILSME
jgi:hypothetical protein